MEELKLTIRQESKQFNNWLYKIQEKDPFVMLISINRLFDGYAKLN